MTDDRFWVDQLASAIVESRGDGPYTFSAGMSVSGPMHIGNLRGELMVPTAVRRALDADVTFRGVYYTQDAFKGKDAQLRQFDDPDAAERYTGWRLIDVPDPEGCHENWVQHFNAANDPYLSEFGIDLDTVTTTAVYTWDAAQEVVARFLRRREEVREILNEYRDRQPYPEGWIPFNPRCDACNRIDATEATAVDVEAGTVDYRCDACGEDGTSALEEGKLAWRLEWSMLWEVLDVDFEPYGEDHATPGGSRDSCEALSEAFDMNVPHGFSFNWVYLQEGEEVREMTSSGAVGITAEEYLAVASPAVLNYLYLSTRPMTEIYFDPADLPTYYRRFDEAEELYFEGEAEGDARDRARAYELAMPTLPETRPVRVPFDHAAFVAQTVPEDRWRDRGVTVLQRTGHLPDDASEADVDRAMQRLSHALAWARRYAPDDAVYTFNGTVPDAVREELSEAALDAMRDLHALLTGEEYTDSEELEDDLFEVARESAVDVGGFFTAAYRCLLSREDGPRLAAFILTRGQDRVAETLASLE